MVLVAVNFVYFTGRALPFKYLLPGLVFLIAFQFYTMVYTGYASFTNYGTNHLGDKDAAILSIQRRTWCRSRADADVPRGADRQGRHRLDAGHRPETPSPA